jgi:hypothetical protein
MKTITTLAVSRSARRVNALALAMHLAIPVSFADVVPAATGLSDYQAEAKISKPAAVVQIENRPASVADSHEIRITKLEFKKARLVDVMRTISEISDINIVPTKEAGEVEVTVYLRNVTVHEAIDTISRSHGLWYRQDKISRAYRVMTAKEYQSDMVVFRDDVTKVFNLLHPNPIIVASAIEDLYGQRVIMSLGIEQNDFGMGGMGMGAGGTSAGRGIGGGARSGQAGLRRQTGARAGGGMGGRRGGVGARRGLNRQTPAEEAITETLTPEQLARLDEAMEASEDNLRISSDQLQGVSRNEQPIYVTVNREHNLIIVRTSDLDVLRDIEALIKEMDKPTQQVLLEMRILELTLGDSYNQLFNFEYLSSDGESFIGLGNQPVPSQSGSLIYSFLNSRIAARLELLQRNNQINTLSSPILMASNNRPARVFVGEERVLVTGVTATDPVISAVGTVITPARITYDTELRDIGNTLNIIPKINADGTVTLSIQQDVSSVLEGAVTLPPITVGNNTQSFSIDSVRVANVEGTVVAKDGLTVAIGGLISDSKTYNETKVPILGDVPLLGELFKSKEEINRKSEMILLITPRIVRQASETENVTAETLEEVSMQTWYD